MHAVLPHGRDILAVCDAALRHHRHAVGNARQESVGGFKPRLEGLQVAVVDADQARLDLQGRLELLPVVDLHEHVQTERDGRFVQGLELSRVEGGRYEKHAVRAHCACFEQLICVHHEILAQHGQVHGRSGGVQVLVVALEVALVGKNGEAGGAPLGVAPGNGHGVEIFPYDAFAGRCSLDLCDHA